MRKHQTLVLSALLSLSMFGTYSLPILAEDTTTETQPGTSEDEDQTESGSTDQPEDTVTVDHPSAADTTPYTVQVKANGATIQAFQIIKGNYSDNGLTGYVPYNENVATVIGNGPYSAEDKLVYENISKLISLCDLDGNHNGLIPGTELEQVSATPDANGNYTYSADLHAGTYLFVIQNPGESTLIYKPFIISASYGDDGKLSTDQYNPEKDTWGSGDTSIPKSEDPSIDKNITNTDRDQNESGDGAAFDYDAPIEFTVTTSIPNYNHDIYNKGVVFNISDSFSNGLSFDTKQGIAITVDGTTLESGKDTYTINPAVKDIKNHFTVIFSSSYILDHPGEQIQLVYYAKITDKDKINFQGTNNKVTLDYSNNPSDINDTEQKDDQTFQYTFAIDGSLNGQDNDQTNEIIKIEGEFTGVTTGSTTQHTPLAGAEFSIYPATASEDGKTITMVPDSKPIQTVTTDQKGLMNFTGLDAGYYVIKETKAPAGYTINETPIPVSIQAEYYTDTADGHIKGQLKSYTIIINGQATSTYTMTNNGTTNVITSGPDDSWNIANTKIPGLPSTGGSGTVLFTAAGVALMALAVVVLVRRRSYSGN